MTQLPQELLSAALHLKWDGALLNESHARELLAERAPGYTPDQYAEAIEQARQFDNAVCTRANAWFTSQGKAAWPDREELERTYPGFAHDDYFEAINNNILWARK